MPLIAQTARFLADSPLDGARFEPSVRLEKLDIFRSKRGLAAEKSTRAKVIRRPGNRLAGMVFRRRADLDASISVKAAPLCSSPTTFLPVDRNHHSPLTAQQPDDGVCVSTGAK
jgi:hypothetical protein